MDTFIVEFSGELNGAPGAELRALQDTSGEFKVEREGERFALISGFSDYLRDAAFINHVSRLMVTADDYTALKGASIPEGRFYVRVSDMRGCHDSSFERVIGDVLGARGRVSFEHPDFVLRAIHSDRWYLGLAVHSRDPKQFEGRRAPLRPFFSPVSLHPRYARLLVHMSRCRKGETLLDPFCGTGGILIEAGLTGRRVIGNDVSLNMAYGARLNLKYFRIDGTILNTDISKLDVDGVDAIATDMPYGRNASIRGHSRGDFYKVSFERMRSLLRNGRYASVIVSDLSVLEMADGFRLVDCVAVRQHRSLTRYFCSLRAE